MRIRRSSTRALLACLAGLLAAGCTATAPAGPGESAPKRAAETSRETGAAPAATAGSGGPLGAEQVQSRWWSWAAASPAGSNPVRDPDGTFCAEHQPADVWFLAGNFGGESRRSCSVPAGRPLVFPVVAFAGTQAECAGAAARAEGTATLDGRPVELVRHGPTPIRFTGTEDNPVTREAGTFTTQSCGLWARLDPPAPGQHALAFTGTLGGLRIRVEYALRIG
ncbi:signal protein [Streptomyces sp. NPDC002054]|uniref:signal protein n=1 Tax=Streptomyces sp. NPDC002054 TaxID=3154663 RepID=UPI0033192D46